MFCAGSSSKESFIVERFEILRPGSEDDSILLRLTITRSRDKEAGASEVKLRKTSQVGKLPDIQKSSKSDHNMSTNRYSCCKTFLANPYSSKIAMIWRFFLMFDLFSSLFLGPQGPHGIPL